MAMIKIAFMYDVGIGTGILEESNLAGRVECITRMQLNAEDAVFVYEGMRDLISIMRKKIDSKENSNAEQNGDTLD